MYMKILKNLPEIILSGAINELNASLNKVDRVFFYLSLFIILFLLICFPGKKIKLLPAFATENKIFSINLYISSFNDSKKESKIVQNVT